MRSLLVMLVAAAMLAGCGGEAEAPEVSISDAAWSGGEILIEAEANLPDGAVLSWYVVEGDDWEDLDASDERGFATVEAGTAQASADVADFEDGSALVEVAFVPGYSGQPQAVQDAYEASDGASAESALTR